MLARLSILLLFQQAILAADPSIEPAHDPRGERKYAERWRVVADLDGDGHPDMLISTVMSDFGQAGGRWDVYLWRDADYKRVGEIFASPRAIALEPDHSRWQRDEAERFYVRIWTYSHISGSEGGLGYYRVGPNSVEDVKGVDIYPGDGGTDLGRAVFDAVLKHSIIPFELQRSETDSDGHVRWHAERA
jgi:hypothetical protein